MLLLYYMVREFETKSLHGAFQARYIEAVLYYCPFIAYIFRYYRLCTVYAAEKHF